MKTSKHLIRVISFIVLTLVGLTNIDSTYAVNKVQNKKNEEIKIYINNKQFKPQNQIRMEKGVCFVPARELCNFLGAEIEWDKEKEVVNITYYQDSKKKLLQQALNSNLTNSFNGEEINIATVEEEYTPKLINSRIYMSLELIFDELGGNITSDDKTKTILINSVPEINKSKYIEPFGKNDYIALNSKSSELTKLFGKPKEYTRKYNNGIDKWTQTLYYKFGKFETYTDDKSKEDFVYMIEIDSNLINGPRNIRVGDDVNSVIAKFPNYKHDISGDKKVLYNIEYMIAELSAYVLYENGKIKGIYYSDDTDRTYINFEIKNDKVDKIKMYSKKYTFK